MSFSSRSGTQEVTEADIQGYVKAILNLTSKKNFNHKQLAGILAQIPPSTLSRMSESNESVAKFLEAETNLGTEFANNLAANLQRNKLFSEKIESINGKEKCSVLDRYKGFYHYNSWKQVPDDVTNLDKACDEKIFDALKERCRINIKKIKSSEENATAEQQLKADISTLSNVYWFAGAMQGALFFLDLANHYANMPDERASQSVIYYETSLGFFLRAQELANMSMQDPASVSCKLACYIYNVEEFTVLLEQKLNTVLGGAFKNLHEVKPFFSVNLISHLLKTHVLPNCWKRLSNPSIQALKNKFLGRNFPRRSIRPIFQHD